MLQYFFIRTKRRLKAKLARNNWKLSFGRGKFLRWGGFFSLLLLILQISPSVAGSYKKQEGGDVAGTAKSPSAEEVELEEQIEERITYPHRIAESRSFPDLTARAVVIVDEETDKVLYEQNADIRFPPASLTKMMTALVALDIYEFYEVITVPEQCSQDMVGTAQMGLVENERITVETLLYGLLVNSAADAACVLVNGVGEERLFISLMNQKAAELGLADTHFVNAVGFDHVEQYSTAEDLVTMAQIVMDNNILRKIVGTQQLDRGNVYDNPTRWHELHSTNQLLTSLPGVTGVKTGKTDDAGECLAISWMWEGRELYAVILGSDDRFGEMGEVIKWVQESFRAHP